MNLKCPSCCGELTPSTLAHYDMGPLLNGRAFRGRVVDVRDLPVLLCAACGDFVVDGVDIDAAAEKLGLEERVNARVEP